MRFDIHDRFELEIRREGGRWVAYRAGRGLRRRDPDVVIPADLTESELETWLDDLFHEYAAPGASIRRLD